MTAEMSGTLRQNRRNVRACMVARVIATTGPSEALRAGVNGCTPDHLPRDDVGVSRIVHDSDACLAQRRYTGAVVITRRAVSASGHVANIAQTAVLGRGVNPSPVPVPHSFQNPTSGIRQNDNRAAPICPNTHNRAGSDGNR